MLASRPGRWARVSCCSWVRSPLGSAQAPGAPGDRHTWAPADKHGFGTATGSRSNVWFTLRAAELSEVYYPDLGTPSLRDLEFAVTDGRTFLDRETDPGVEPARSRPQPGSLTFRQIDRRPRAGGSTKTWVTDPERRPCSPTCASSR